jgi:hypothetical protein
VPVGGRFFVPQQSIPMSCLVRTSSNMHNLIREELSQISLGLTIFDTTREPDTEK